MGTYAHHAHKVNATFTSRKAKIQNETLNPERRRWREGEKERGKEGDRESERDRVNTRQKGTQRDREKIDQEYESHRKISIIWAIVNRIQCKTDLKKQIK